jgi:hypothetical protein
MPQMLGVGVPTGDGRLVVTTAHGSTLNWQDRPRGGTGGSLVGDTPETMLPLVIARLRQLNHEPNTPGRETSLAITHCEEALHWLTARRADRDARGVTGTPRP